uniref:Uncharacterized protein n=1 Tax=Rhodopseudomonas palustris (strain BisA53) TaxID=316055 RepID=Q07NU0_RHOP5
MTAIRTWIIQSIRRILSGENFTYEDFKAQPLDGEGEIKSQSRFATRPERDPEHFAWLLLQMWVNDDDIRAKDPEYGEMKKRQLQDLLDRIEGRSP